MAVRDPLEPAAQTHPLNAGAPMAEHEVSDSFETILGHTFKRPSLLKEALTHSSVVHRQGRKQGSNERLEFMGDRVLGLVMAEWLIERYPHEQEGELGPRLAYLVSQPVLAKVADSIGLAGALSVGRGEAKSGLAKRSTVLADALEAALGALYLDGGLDVVRLFIHRAWNDVMVGQVEPPKDAKTALQHWALKRALGLPTYEVTARSGPEHAPKFTVTVYVGDSDASGTAGSKRAAEQLAAEALLARLSA
jgi:ribonuclease-3